MNDKLISEINNKRQNISNNIKKDYPQLKFYKSNMISKQLNLEKQLLELNITLQKSAANLKSFKDFINIR